MLHHPDKNQGDPEAHGRFQEINHAYDILSDPNKRETYDQLGADGMNGNGGAGPGFGGPFGGGFGGGFGFDQDELFEHMFGGMGDGGGFAFDFGEGPSSSRRREPRRPTKTQDVTQDYNISLQDAYNGKTFKMVINRNITCHTCEGRGLKQDAKTRRCATCTGSGTIKTQRQVAPGIIAQTPSECPDCGGTGKIIREKDRCKKCKGKKIVTERKIVELHVERGMESGDKIIIPSMADQDPEFPEAAAGDVVLVIRMKDHDTFKRKGRDLKCTVKISLAEALGGFSKIVVLHLDGRGIKVTTIPGKVIRPGDIHRVRGEGMPIGPRRDAKGDLYIHWEIVFPEDGFITSSNASTLEAFFAKAQKVPRIPPPDIVDSVVIESASKDDYGRRGAGRHGPRAYDDDDDSMKANQDSDPSDPQCAHQ